MGADLSFALVPITRPKEEALSLLRAMSNDTLVTKIKYTHLDDDEDIFDDDGNVDRAELLKRLEESLDIVYECSDGELRYGGSIKIDDCRFAFAGGITWGDPVEYVDDLSIIDSLGVTHDQNLELKWVPR